jgi:HAD superfamily hydrolase (TIGR01509 family)
LRTNTHAVVPDSFYEPDIFQTEHHGFRFTASMSPFLTKHRFAEISLEGIQGACLDLDDTLYAYEPCNKAGFLAVLERVEQEQIVEPLALEQAWKEARSSTHRQLSGQAASHSRLLYLHSALELLFGRSEPALALELESCFWNAYLQAMEWNPEAEAFLQRLKSAGISACIVTDLTSHIQFRKWAHLELHRYCDFMVTSEEAGLEKPNPMIFQKALSKLQLAPEQVIMVGDNHEKDILGATQLGMRAYLI